MAAKTINCSLGKLSVIATEAGITDVSFCSKIANYPDSNSTKAKKHIAKFEKAIKQYLSGNDSAFKEIELAVCGTPFQLAVWKELRKIPIGKTRTYSEIAKKIGRPKAARAVGTACGKNKLLLVIPCHRVVATTGLGGFAAGINKKKELLKRESLTP